MSKPRHRDVIPTYKCTALFTIMRMKKNWHRFSKFILVIGLVLAAAIISGCGEKGTVPDAGTFAIKRHYTQGPATVDLRVSRDAITIAEKVTLEISARVDEGYAIELPEFDKTSDTFQIASVISPPPELDDGGRILSRKTYVLKPFLSGTYTIPSMTVRVSKPGEKASEPVVIETEPIDITVNSLLADQTDPALADIFPPEALPEKPYLLMAAIAAALLVAGLGFFGYRYFRRQKNGSESVIIRPPHEIAHARLRDLLAEQLVEKGECKLFYLRLSGILRHYIENRFGLKAPEQTTEEFLKTMKTADDLTPSHKQVLRRFLEHCDLVKFAGHEPAAEEIRETIDTVRQFIDETVPAPAEETKPDREKQNHAV